MLGFETANLGDWARSRSQEATKITVLLETEGRTESQEKSGDRGGDTSAKN